MARFRCLTWGLALAALLTIRGTAAADPVPITSGHLSIGGTGFLTNGFLASIGYDFSTDSFRLAGGQVDGPQQNVFSPFLVIPSSYWTIPPGPSEILARPFASLVFTTTPATTPTPFQLSGTLSIFDHISGALLFSDAVSGAGTATWRFDLTPSGTPVVSAVNYVFQDVAPTPEPATFMLLAAGLGTMAARRIRSARRTRGPKPTSETQATAKTGRPTSPSAQRAILAF
jgi:hypothetical protein